jgi:hypothetical protein
MRDEVTKQLSELYPRAEPETIVTLKAIAHCSTSRMAKPASQADPVFKEPYAPGDEFQVPFSEAMRLVALRVASVVTPDLPKAVL